MNILVINYEYPPLGGGGGVAAKNLCEGLVNDGHKIDYLTSMYGDFPKEESINGVNIYREKIIGKRQLKSAGILSLVFFPVCVLSKACELCEKNKYDYIHTHFAVPSGPLGMRVAEKYKIPNVLFVYGGDIYDPTKKFSPHRWMILRTLISKILCHSDIIIAESTDIKEKVSKFYKVNKEVKVLPIIYNKIKFNMADRKELFMKEDITYFVSVGRLVKRKGYSFLVDIATQLEENIKVLIIGEGPDRDFLEKKIKDLGLGKKVLLMGNLSEEKKFQYLSNSDIYILSSVHEGFGIVLQEAMQAGLPIIATDNGGQKDIIQNGVNGFLIKYGDAGTCCKIIERLLKNSNERMQISRNNMSKINEFSEQNIVKKCLNLMKEI